ncbi:MAG: NodT family efflux transporter outer membrane factor (OMF) lipoprotein [Mariniblastus sp.]
MFLSKAPTGIVVRHLSTPNFKMTFHHKIIDKIAASLVLAIAMSMSTGCQHTNAWLNNGKRVGPNYSQPSAAVADSYIDHNRPGSLIIDMSQDANAEWWKVFNDPDLNSLIDQLKQENLSLKAASYRIKEARHQRNIASANLFPQSQKATAAASHTQISRNSGAAFPGAPLTVNDLSIGFDASWEVDLWGRIGRSIVAADAQLEAQVHDYNFAMVTLIGDVASLYIQIRAFDERIALAQENVTIQEGSLDIAQKRFDQGRTDKLDVLQAESNLATTKSLVPQFELARRQSLNALSILIGVPPSGVPFLAEARGTIPFVPAQAAVGIPASLLLRRPDIMAAERNMAAQFEQIGISEAALYPTLAVSGTLGWDATRLSNVFESASYNGTIAPGFSWNILNYGRLKEAILVEESRFQQIQADFENTVLNAQREVEDGLIEFVKKQEQYQFNLQTTKANKESVKLALVSFTEGKSDFGRVFVVQANLVVSQDQLVDTRASIALALIKTYKALGGGWETSSASPTVESAAAAFPSEF